MAGSYRHLVNDNLQYVGLGSIEDEGDAAEAIGQLYGMVCWLAIATALHTGRGYKQVIAEAESNWKTGITLAGDARPHD
jgi:hypothetical protein